MPEYTFRALGLNGQLESGRLAARDEDELADYLRIRGKFLVQSSHVQKKTAPVRTARADYALEREDLLAFTDYMAGSLQVGIPLLTALEETRTRIRSRRLGRIVQELSVSVSEHGRSLSEAMREHPKAFSRPYAGTVAAGEASGHLDHALQQLAEYLEWQQEINVHVRQALLYPAIIVTVVITLMTALLLFVYPRILPVLQGFDAELPQITVAMITIASFLRANLLLIGGGIVGTAAALLAARQTRRGRYVLDTVALRVPIFGPLVQRINMARVVTYFGLFYRTGVELVLSLTLLEEMITNRRVARAIATVRASLLDGQTMTQAFSNDPLFPPEVVRSISLGETTGAMDESLARVRKYYAREVPASVKRMLTALQPILIVLLGGLILLVALSIVLPIVSIYDNLGRMR